jgi:hypothetical protein
MAADAASAGDATHALPSRSEEIAGPIRNHLPSHRPGKPLHRAVTSTAFQIRPRAQAREPFGDAIGTVKEVEISCDRGFVRLRLPSHGVLVVVLAGEVDASVVPLLTAALDESLRGAPRDLCVFWDLDSLDWLDPGLRCALTDAVAKRRRSSATVEVLVRARWVRLAVSVASLRLALDEVRITEDRTEFESDLEATVARRGRRTNAWELAASLAA